MNYLELFKNISQFNIKASIFFLSCDEFIFTTKTFIPHQSGKNFKGTTKNGKHTVFVRVEENNIFGIVGENEFDITSHFSTDPRKYIRQDMMVI